MREGNIATVGDTAERTPGSDLITDLLLDDQPGTLVLQAWGGLNTIARALMSVQERFAATPEWPEVQARISARTVLTSWGQQDSTFADYIRPNWPTLELRQVATAAWGYAARAVTDPDAQEYLSPEWTRANVSEVGPIGAAYRVWGDGLQMADGFDAEDYFGLRDVTVEELRERGYRVFFGVEPPGAWISEGDTSNVALHLAPGLRNWEHPSYGGWGGRQAAHSTDPHQWVSVGAEVMDFSAPPQDWGDVARWLPAFQRDFAARLRWSVTPEYDGANHHPLLAVPTGVDVSGAPGDRVRIAWQTSDPDGDAVSVTAWQYVEAGTCPATAELDRVADDALEIVLPPDAEPGQTIHVILEATDDGAPALTTYARVILTVA